MKFIQSWRWYGPKDKVTLEDAEQAGATDIVHALHHIPVGETWSVEEIEKRKKVISFNENTNKKRNLTWSVVESVNIHESIKKGLPERDIYIDRYIQTLKNLATCGIYTVCYNFMPVLDWVRTDLSYTLEDGSKALRYDAIDLAAFDLYILKRPEATDEYTSAIKEVAQQRFQSFSTERITGLQKIILAGLPGADEEISIEDFRAHLQDYKAINAYVLKENLKYFLKRVIPEAEKLHVKLAIHPDDPPFSVFGLTRIVSTEEDLNFLLDCVDSPSNGITFCTGSLGPRLENNLVEMVERLGPKIHFIHLRNIQRQEQGSFYEADHLNGNIDMYEVMKAIINEQKRRVNTGRSDISIPIRPDHGHDMMDDLSKDYLVPGYSAIGRLKGLAELRGLELGIRNSLKQDS